MNALITGGSRGIGECTSEYFIKKGINTIIPTREELDLNSPSDIKAYVSTLPKIDILVNNAGINKIQNIEEVEYKDLLETFNINFFSSYYYVLLYYLSLKNRITDG